MISRIEIPNTIDFAAGETILFDKPSGISSFDVIRKIRKVHFIKKIGHAGTLDPLATGLLILCTGRFTKKINEYQGLPKQYTATMKLGATTASYDTETELEETFKWKHISRNDVEAVIPNFLGDINQVPPVYSAIRVNGERLYKKALRGEKPELKPRKIHIESIEIVKFNLPEIVISVKCSKGTYIRSLVHDMGKALDSGACMTALRRDAIGEFRADNAIDIGLFKELISNPDIEVKQ